MSLTLLATLLLAQANGPRLDPGDLLKRRRYETVGTATQSYYVTTGGSDAAGCTLASPCLTIAGALAKLPPRIASPVEINVGAGTFSGFQVSDRTFAYRASNTTSLTIRGTLVNATLGGGTATGTATSAVQGATINAVSSLTDIGQAWTPGAMRGLLIEITGGINSGDLAVIEDNTATQVSIAGRWVVTPNATSTYAIRDWATIISAAGTTPPAFTTATSGAPTAAQVHVFGISGVRGVTLERIHFTDTGTCTRPVVVGGGSGSTLLQHNRFSATVTCTQLGAITVSASATADTLPGPGAVEVVENYLYSDPGAAATTSRAGIYAETNGNAGITVLGNVLDSHKWGVLTLSGLTHVNTSPSRNSFRDIRGAGFVIAGTPTATQFAGDEITCGTTTSTQGIQFSSGTNGQRIAGALTVFGATINSCGTMIEADGFGTVNLPDTSVLAGIGNTNGISLSNGARARINSSVAYTATNELSIDGALYTLAALRALTPKRITDLGTISTVWE